MPRKWPPSLLGRLPAPAEVAKGSRWIPRLCAAATMGREFGKLSRVRHVISYSLSPFEQQAFPHYFSKGVPNMLRRIQATILRAAPRSLN